MKLIHWLICALIFVVPFSWVDAQTMESVFEVDILKPDSMSNDRETIASYWIRFAQEQSKDIEFDLPSPSLDEKSLKHRLRAELLPLTTLFERYAELPPGEQRDRIYQQIQSKSSDFEFAERLFEVMGPEYCQNKIVEKVALTLVEFQNQQRIKWDEMTSGLQFVPLATRLKLTKSQKADIKNELGNSSSELGEIVGKLLRDLTAASNDRWGKLLRIADADQREYAEKRIGKPVEWHRSIRKQQVREYLHDQFAPVRVVGQTTIDEDAASERMLGRIPPEEKYVAIEQLILRMIGDEVIWDELELIENQRTKLKPFGEGNYGKSLYVLAIPKRRFAELLNGTSTLPDEIEDILLPDQLEWFRQIEFQIRTEPKYDSTVGLLDPRVVKHLKLTDKQQAEMKLIGDEFAEVLRTSTEKINAEKKRIEDELESKLADLLDEEQLVLYRKFTKTVPSKDGSRKEAGVSR